METSVTTLEYTRIRPEDTTWRAETINLLWQSGPNVLSAVLRMSMTFTDFIFVSHLGTEAQAAVSPASLLCFIVVATGMAMASTVTTFAAQAVGRRDPREATRFAWQTIYLAGILTLASWPLMYAMDPLFSLFGADANVRQMQVQFCRIGVWSIGPTILAAGFEGFFNAIKKPIIGTIAMVVAVLWNILGNYMLIYGHFGAPQMGIAGSSLSTVVAWSLRAVILLGVFFGAHYAREYGTRIERAFSGDRLKRLIRIGAPTSVQWVLDIGAWFLFMEWMMGRYGKEAMAGANISLQYMHLSFMPAIGIGIALCAVVGHAIGEGRHDLAVRRTRIACVMVMTYMTLAGVGFFVFRYPLMRLLAADAGVVQIGAVMLVWAAVFQSFDGMCIVFTNALRGAGDTRWITAAYVLTGWGIFIAGGALLMWLAPGWGIHGPWLACTSYIIVLGLVLMWRFANGPWRDIRLFDAKSDQPTKIDQPATAAACDQEPVVAMVEQGIVEP